MIPKKFHNFITEVLYQFPIIPKPRGSERQGVLTTSHSFAGSGVWRQLSWGVLAGPFSGFGPLEGCLGLEDPLLGCHVHWAALLGAGCWQGPQLLPKGPLHRGACVSSQYGSWFSQST